MKKNKRTQYDEKINIPVSKSLETNINKMKDILKDCDDIIFREFNVGKKQQHKFYIVYVDGLADKELVSENVLESLMIDARDEIPNPRRVGQNLYDLSKKGSITITEVQDTSCLSKAIEAVLIGETIVIMEGFDNILIVSSRGWPMRSISEPETETVIRGPRDGFTETSKVNTSLIRRRIRDPRLKLKYIKVGKRSKTDIAIMYIDDVVDKEILEEVKKRLSNIEVDSILESSYIEQLIEDNWLSPFPQLENTERPDAVAAAIYEGRVALIIDNTPFALMVPATFSILLQSSEDYYERWIPSVLIRFVRYIAIPLSLLLPSLYIALTSYHPGMIPTELALYVAATRVDVPFPAFVEAFIMEGTLELLREAGTRISGPIGTTIGIVGGLVIGQAAVEAGIVSPLMVIIVAVTTVASFALPNFSLASGFRFIRFILMALSAVLGLYGVVLGLLLMTSHLVSLKSFGVPYMEPFSSMDFGFTDIKDSIVRLPYKFMKLRPKYLKIKDRVRMENSDDINKIIDEKEREE